MTVLKPAHEEEYSLFEKCLLIIHAVSLSSVALHGGGGGGGNGGGGGLRD